ncbi:MAG: insulinase family protein [Clostridioides sp.]|jgi:predicted Zn-dependent peptidase|nr:insulinase family protein [Clostridioides sp.]
MADLKTMNLGDNINLTLIKSSKFKTNLISVYIQRNLDRDEVTKNSLLAEVIISGSEKYPSLREITSELENFYGASLASNAIKKSEKQIIQFRLFGVNDKFLDEKVFKDMVVFLDEIINHPLVVDAGFDERYLAIEKTNLKDRIRASINDKMYYSQKKCIEAMCEGEKYSIDECGYEEDIDGISARDLYEHYRNVLKTSPIDIIVEGDFDEDEVVSIMKDKFNFDRGDIIEIPKEDFKKEVTQVKNIEEKMEIAQGKLIMGFRANVDYMDIGKYCALMVGNSVLGGGAHSKLFNNVREKESLCYYIYSSVEKSKSLMFISSGIEVENYDKARKIIDEQLKEVQNGNITEDELTNSKKALISGTRSVADNIGGMSEFTFSQFASKSNQTLDELIEAVEKVTVDEIVDTMKNIELDTVYFLRN